MIPGSAGRSPLRTLTPYSCTARRVATLAVARAAGSTPKTTASEESLLARPAMEAASLRRRASISSCFRCCLLRFCSAGTSWLAKAPRPLACRSLSGLVTQSGSWPRTSSPKVGSWPREASASKLSKSRLERSSSTPSSPAALTAPSDASSSTGISLPSFCRSSDASSFPCRNWAAPRSRSVVCLRASPPSSRRAASAAATSASRSSADSVAAPSSSLSSAPAALSSSASSRLERRDANGATSSASCAAFSSAGAGAAPAPSCSATLAAPSTRPESRMALRTSQSAARAASVASSLTLSITWSRLPSRSRFAPSRKERSSKPKPTAPRSTLDLSLSPPGASGCVVSGSLSASKAARSAASLSSSCSVSPSCSRAIAIISSIERPSASSAIPSSSRASSIALLLTPTAAASSTAFISCAVSARPLRGDLARTSAVISFISSTSSAMPPRLSSAAEAFCAAAVASCAAVCVGSTTPLVLKSEPIAPMVSTALIIPSEMLAASRSTVACCFSSSSGAAMSQAAPVRWDAAPAHRQRGCGTKASNVAARATSIVLSRRFCPTRRGINK